VDRERNLWLPEVIVGFLGRGQGTPVLTFMQVRDLTGDSTTPDFMQGPLEALNLMCAQGWQLRGAAAVRGISLCGCSTTAMPLLMTRTS